MFPIYACCVAPETNTARLVEKGVSHKTECFLVLFTSEYNLIHTNNPNPKLVKSGLCKKVMAMALSL
jgi:hypothetical protein